MSFQLKIASCNQHQQTHQIILVQEFGWNLFPGDLAEDRVAGWLGRLSLLLFARHFSLD